MSAVSDLKARAEALETAGDLPGALEAFRQCLRRLEGTPEFLRELPLLVKVGDLEARLGRSSAAIASYERAAEVYIRNGRAESVVATALRIARLRPQAAPLMDYPLRLVGFGHVEAARFVLFEFTRRTGRRAEAEELDALHDAPEADIVAAIERIVGGGREAPRTQKLSLEDAIAEMRRKSGLVARPHEPEDVLPPPPPVVKRPSRRPVVLVLLVAGALGAVGFLILSTRPAPAPAPVVLEGPAPSPPEAVAAAEAPPPRLVVDVPPLENPVPVERSPARPATGVGLLTADGTTPPAELLIDVPDTSARADSELSATAGPDVPRLPAGAVVTQAVVAIGSLPITRIAHAGRGYRLTQALPDRRVIQLTLVPLTGESQDVPRVAAVPPEGASGSRSFGGYLVSARGPVSPDSLRQLLLRLVVVPPRQ